MAKELNWEYALQLIKTLEIFIRFVMYTLQERAHDEKHRCNLYLHILQLNW